jgi:hypothetical protein
MIKEYRLVLGKSSQDLSQKINEMIRQGWEIYGDPFSDSSNDETFLLQAVVLKDKSEP